MDGPRVTGDVDIKANEHQLAGKLEAWHSMIVWCATRNRSTMRVTTTCTTRKYSLTGSECKQALAQYHDGVRERGSGPRSAVAL